MNKKIINQESRIKDLENKNINIKYFYRLFYKLLFLFVM